MSSPKMKNILRHNYKGNIFIYGHESKLLVFLIVRELKSSKHVYLQDLKGVIR
jgi:hypothetical protein